MVCKQVGLELNNTQQNCTSEYTVRHSEFRSLYDMYDTFFIYIQKAATNIKLRTRYRAVVMNCSHY